MLPSLPVNVAPVRVSSPPVSAFRNGFRISRLVFAAMPMLLILFFPSWGKAQDETKFWPELDTYVNLSSRSRFFFLAQLNNDQDTRQVQGQFGPNFDFYLRPFLRPHLRDLDPAKSKLLTFRIGYRYLPTLRGDGPTENRPIAELTARFQLPWAILLSDRNRLDFRFVSEKPFSWRYRNRLSLERNFSIRNYMFTPYIRGELFYDSRVDKIAKNSFIIGSVFPLTKRTEFQFYYEDQRDSSTTPVFHVRGAGLVLSLFLNR
jgi:hypothetical protein